MKELLACEGSISGEHLISESVIHLLAGDGEFTIEGTPWLPAGVTKAIGPKSLTANCLCQRHNGRLSPLDEAAHFFFSRMKHAFEEAALPANHLVSGHDLERWLLKTLKALAVSGNLAQGKQRLTGEFASDIRLLEMLENIRAWPPGTGLYCVMKAGDLTANHNRFRIAPLTNANEEICGLWTDILGLGFVLVLDVAALKQLPELSSAVFRPQSFRVLHPHITSRLILSWDDGHPHRGEMSLKFVQNLES